MCVAVLKPAGVKTPSKKILRECWNNNPNGAGYCYNDGKEVVIHKGFMTFREFYKSFNEYDYTNCDLIIHFRIATHGGVNKECTHPFVISKNINDLKKLDVTCKSAFVHNGIISGYGSRNDTDKVSDTMDYVTKIIANIPQMNHTLLNNLANEKSSRFAILLKDRYMLGGNWVKDKGVFYSNSSYKPKPKPQIISYHETEPLIWKKATCEWCGQETYFTRKVHFDRYGETYNVCLECYDDYLQMKDEYEKDLERIYNKDKEFLESK